MVKAAVEGVDDVRVGLALGVAGTRVRVAGADLGKARGRTDARRAQANALERNRLAHLARPQAEVRGKRRRGRTNRRRVGALILKSPAPVVPSPDVHRGESMLTSLGAARDRSVANAASLPNPHPRAACDPGPRALGLGPREDVL